MTDLAGRVAALTPDQRRELAQRLAARRTVAAEREVPRRPAGATEVPLSFAQERLWFLDQLSPGDPTYNLSFSHALGVSIDHAALVSALSFLVERHESLRTSFPVVDEEPRQRVSPAGPATCPLVDLRHLPARSRRTAVQRLSQQLAGQPFDLACGPLYRCALARLGEYGDVFVFVVHHIIADGWSVELLFRELSTVYTDIAGGRLPSLTAPPLQYADYTLWQRHELRDQVLDRLVTHWRGVLADAATLELPTDRPRPRVQSSSGADLRFEIDATTVQAVRDLARGTDATPFMVLLAAFTATLHAYTGQDDIVVGTPVASRNRAELEGVVGFFANNVVLRTDAGGDPTFLEHVRRTRQVTIEAYQHQDLPFSKLVHALSPRNDTTRNPLFQVSFQLLSSYQAQRSTRPGTAGGADVPFERGTAVFDLALNLAETGSEVRGQLEYSTDLFDTATVEALRDHYLTLLGEAVAAPETPIGALDMLTSAEHARLDAWEHEASSSERPTALVGELVRDQAHRTPHAVAVRSVCGTLTYRDLVSRSSELAAGISNRVGAHGHVGVLMRPTTDLVATLLGVLASGNAYVPLDPAAPSGRLLGILKDAGVRLAVVDPGSRHGEPGFPGIDTLTPDELADDPEHAPEAPVDASTPAYVLFTSGSTGRPKGVVVAHHSLATYVSWCAATYPSSDGVGAPLVSSVTADMAVTSLFVPLVTGRTVFLLDDVDTVEALDTALRGPDRFSFVKLTPSHLHALRNLSIGRTVPAATHAFVVGGEALSGATLAPWRDANPELEVWNEYGPTEATVACSAYHVRAGNIVDGPVPIGGPIAGAVLQVLDRHGRRVPVGVPGQLIIGGPGVAVGYLGEACASSTFFDEGTAGRRYWSGDLVRRRHDGTLEFLGRMDRQVKIRGHRVEPGEVEAVLSRHPAVTECTVVARQLGADDRRLVAYVVLAGVDVDDVALTGELAALARRELAAPMVPSRIVVVEAMPLTRSGKVDTAALETGLPEQSGRTASPTAPETPLEEVVALVFADVLGGQVLDTGADFFGELGGDSLLATKVVARLRDYLAVDVPLRLLFENAQAGSMARALRDGAQDPDVLQRRASVLLEVLGLDDGAAAAPETKG